MRVGLLGGSFNPPHEGHVHISLLALKTLQLDAVWWLVTPHNPLKSAASLMDYGRRFLLSRKITAMHPRIVVTNLEERLGINRTIDTVRAIKRHYPATSFVWLTGLDNALTFHRWHRWQDILKEIPTAHVCRPPAWTLIRSCPLRLLGSQNQNVLNKSGCVSLAPGTSYWLLQKPMLSLSSTQIREFWIT